MIVHIFSPIFTLTITVSTFIQKKKKIKKKNKYSLKNKLRQTKKNEIREGSYLNYIILIKYAFFLLTFFIFHQINLLNIHKKCVLFSSSNFLLVFLLQTQHKRGMSVYKIFNSNYLILLFYSVYLCFIFDLRRDNSKHNYAYFRLWNPVACYSPIHAKRFGYYKLQLSLLTKAIKNLNNGVLNGCLFFC